MSFALVKKCWLKTLRPRAEFGRKNKNPKKSLSSCSRRCKSRRLPTIRTVKKSKVLHVLNTNFKTTGESLKKQLTQVLKQGQILKVKINKDRAKLPTSCAFVEFDSIKTATCVYRDLQNTAVDGSSLIFRFHVKNPDSETAGTLLRVMNVPPAATKEDLKQLFSPFGQIKSITIPLLRYSGRHDGNAYIDFSTNQDAHNALVALSNTIFCGYGLVVKWVFDGVNRSRVVTCQRPRSKKQISNDWVWP